MALTYPSQTGSVTLTLGVAYLTVLAHERNRTVQALHLRSQATVLNSLLEPQNRYIPQLSRAEIARQERSTVTERAKDKWNEEIEKSVRFVQNADWDGLRIKLEDSVSRLLSGGLEKGREGIEEGERRAGPILDEAGRLAHDAAVKAKDESHRLINDAAKGTLRGAEEVKAFAQRTPDMAKAAAEQAQTSAAELAAKSKVVANDAAESLGKAAHSAGESLGAAAEQTRLKTLEAAAFTRRKSEELAEQARIKSHEAAVETQRLARDARLAAKSGAKRAEAGASKLYDQTKHATEEAGNAMHDAFVQGADKAQDLAHKAEAQADKALDRTVEAADEAGLAARHAYDQAAIKAHELAEKTKKEAPGILESIKDSLTTGVQNAKENVK